jgi:hypothetical protein
MVIPISLMVFTLAIIAAPVGFSAGCKDLGSKRHAEANEQIRIALVGEAQDDPTWPVLQATSRWFMDRYHSADVEPMAPLTMAPGEQQKLLLDLAVKPFDSVCVAPSDPDSVRSAIQELVRHGKRVITIGRDVPQSDRHTYSGPSDFEIGRAAAQASAMVLKGRPPTIMLLYAGFAEEAYAARYYAFKEELPLLGDVQLLREVNCEGRHMEASHLVRVEARRYPRVGCWVFLDDWPLRTIPPKERLLPLGCGIVLCNGSPRYFERLRDGQILAMIAFDYRQVVEEALFSATKKASPTQEMPDTSFTLPAEIITVRELESYEQRWKRWQRPDKPAESSAGRDTRSPPQSPVNPSSRPWRGSSARTEEEGPQSSQ